MKLALTFQPRRSSRLSQAAVELRRMFRRSLVHRCANSLIRSATADVAAKRIVNVRVARLRIFRQQRSGRHNHSHLAIAALRHLLIEPRRLHGMVPIGGEPFDRGDISASHRRNPRGTRASRLAIHMYRARAHSAMPHPNFVPVNPKVSRSTQSSGVSGVTSTDCALPFTVIEIASMSFPLCQRDKSTFRTPELQSVFHAPLWFSRYRKKLVRRQQPKRVRLGFHYEFSRSCYERYFPRRAVASHG